MPSDMPSEFTVCRTPEAEPISCGRTPAITMSNSGTNTMPIPIPPTTIGASRSTVETPPPAARSIAKIASSPAASMTSPACSTRRPSLLIAMPPAAEPTNAPAAHGAVVMAECHGLKPSPFCRNTLKIITMPPSEPVNTIENTMPARYGPRRNRDGSTSGSRPARWRRTWYQPNPASTSTDAASIAYSQAGQPSEWPCASGKTSKNMAAPASTAPGRSSRPHRAPPAPEPAPARAGARARAGVRARAGARACARGQQASAERQRREPDRHVHREDHPPAGAEQVGADQPARRDRPEYRRQAHHRPVDAERLTHLVRREQVPDQAEHLRQHDRPEQARRRAGGDKLTRCPGRGARRRRGHEPGHPGQQHSPPPEDVAEPPAGQQSDRHGQGVGGGDPLDDGVGAAEFAPDRRRRDLGDGRVEQIHRRRRDDDAEGHPPPLPSRRPRRPRRRRPRVSFSAGLMLHRAGPSRLDAPSCRLAGVLNRDLTPVRVRKHGLAWDLTLVLGLAGC